MMAVDNVARAMAMDAHDADSLAKVLDTAFVSGGVRVSGNSENEALRDFNKVVKSGMYKYSASPLNRPGNQTYGILLVFNPGNNVESTDNTLYIAQVAFAAVSPGTFNNAAAGTAGVYVRTSNDGGANWSNWFKLAFTDMLPASVQQSMALMGETDDERAESI